MENGTYIYIAGDVSRQVLVPNLCQHVLIASWKLKAGLERITEQNVECKDVLYYEFVPNVEQALVRILDFKRLDKTQQMELIKKKNPDLKDLYYEMWTAG